MSIIHTSLRLETALEYYDLGLNVFPIRSRSQVPLCFWKRFQNIRPPKTTVREWFKVSNINIAIILGKPSGNLICRDFDVLESYHRWRAKVGDDIANRLTTIKTYRGYHVYARISDEEIDGFTKSYIPLGDGEIRVRNCYCLLPPSIHPEGSRYELVCGQFGDDFTVKSMSNVCFDCAFLDKRHTVTHEPHEPHEPHDSQEPNETKESQELHEIQNVKGRTFSDQEKHQIRRLVAETVPKQPGSRNRQVFNFARKLQGLLGNVDPVDLKPIVRHWHQEGNHSGEHTFDETWNDFVYGWSKVRHPTGEVMDRVVSKCIESEHHPVCDSMKYKDQILRFIASLCAALDEFHDHKSFYLGTGVLEKIITDKLDKPISRASIWKHLNRLVTDRVLECTERGNRRYANTYLWIWKPEIRVDDEPSFDWLTSI